MRFSSFRLMSAIIASVAALLSSVFRIRKCEAFALVKPSAKLLSTSTERSRTITQRASLFQLSSTTAAVGDDNSVISEEKTQQRQSSTPMINLYTIEQSELEILIKSWGHESYRAKQVLHWVRNQGAVSVDQMINIPMKLRQDLAQWTSSSSSSSTNTIGGTLTEVTSQVSKDGTIKRLYALNNNDKMRIESVLMPYEDGRNTACISSQAGCAMGCVFCATGQMGFTRQLSAEEIFEQVARFDAQLKSSATDATATSGVSNVVFMGMGEPLANYNNVMKAVRLIRDRLNISARRITISTVGVVPSIRKLILEKDDLQVKLAVSLHCATDEERTKLIPANKRYGGLTELLTSVQEYMEQTKRRITFEWALIEGQNDSVQEARTLGRVLTQGQTKLRRDLIHINVIPLNPTGGYRGSPSGRAKVDAFLRVLTDEFNISATPRVRRGIDIDAGCGQLAAKQEQQQQQQFITDEDIIIIEPSKDELLMFDDGETESERTSFVAKSPKEQKLKATRPSRDGTSQKTKIALGLAAPHLVRSYADNAVQDVKKSKTKQGTATSATNKEKTQRKNASSPSTANNILTVTKTKSTAATPTTNTVIIKKRAEDDENDDPDKKRRRTLLKQLKMIEKLKDMASSGALSTLNDEQRSKISKEGSWRAELKILEEK